MAHEHIVIRGAREHNLKNVTVSLPREQAGGHHRPVRIGQVEPGVRHPLRRGAAPVRRVAVGLRAPVPRARWTSPTSTRSRGCRRRSRSTRRRPPATRARPSARSPRPTTTCACCTRASAIRTARSAAVRSPASRPSRSSTRCSRCRRARGSPSTRRSCAPARASTASCSSSCGATGYTRVKVDGEQLLLEEPIDLDKQVRHTISVVVDRLVMKEGLRTRLTDSVETALRLAEGLVEVASSTARP